MILRTVRRVVISADKPHCQRGAPGGGRWRWSSLWWWSCVWWWSYIWWWSCLWWFHSGIYMVFCHPGGLGGSAQMNKTVLVKRVKLIPEMALNYFKTWGYFCLDRKNTIPRGGGGSEGVMKKKKGPKAVFLWAKNAGFWPTISDFCLLRGGCPPFLVTFLLTFWGNHI